MWCGYFFLLLFTGGVETKFFASSQQTAFSKPLFSKSFLALAAKCFALHVKSDCAHKHTCLFSSKCKVSKGLCGKQVFSHFFGKASRVNACFSKTRCFAPSLMVRILRQKQQTTCISNNVLLRSACCLTLKTHMQFYTSIRKDFVERGKRTQ